MYLAWKFSSFRVARRILPILDLRTTPDSTFATYCRVFGLDLPPGLNPLLTSCVWCTWLGNIQVSVLHGGFCPFWTPRTPPGSTFATHCQVFGPYLPPGLYPLLTSCVLCT